MLIEQIKQDQLNARKARNKELTTLLTTFYSEAAMIGKNDGERLSTDEEVQAVARKFIKNAREVINNLPSDDVRAQQSQVEIDVLSEYLPQQLTDTELQQFITTLIDTNNYTSMKDMGSVMKGLQALYAGRYDGKSASKLIKEQLG